MCGGKTGARTIRRLRLFVADYRVTTLNQPPEAVVVQTVAFSAGTVFFDFADSSYEGGVYAGATFTDASGGGGNQLILRPDGKIEAGDGLTEFGNYAITVEAISPNAENFVGTARLTFRLNYEPPDLRVVPHDEVLAQRNVTIYAAENYEGPAHLVDVAAGYTLEFGERSGAGYTLAARGENDAQFVLNSPLRAPVNVALMPLISCSDCSSRPLTLSASFRPVAAPEQARVGIRLRLRIHINIWPSRKTTAKTSPSPSPASPRNRRRGCFKTSKSSPTH